MGDFWKATAELFTSLIEKPKMNEKLLSKPPFKYLFDIISETTKKTGFANGIYMLIPRTLRGPRTQR
jgi:TRAF3-interacting protein 1